MPRLALVFLLAFVCLPLATTAGSAEETVDYVRQVKPLLAEHCLSCHGALKQQQQLRLDTVAAMRRGGDSGGVVVPGDASASLLTQVLNGGPVFACRLKAKGHD